MSEPRIVRLGTVRVREGSVHVEPEPQVQVDASPGEELALALFYDYEEGSTDRERLRLTIHARLGGAPAVTAEAEVEDRPVLFDVKRGFFSVAVWAPPAGAVDGVAEVRGAYSARPWAGKGGGSELPVRATIPLRVRVA